MARNDIVFNITRGDKFNGPDFTLNVKESDGTTPKNMAGTAVRSQLRDKVDGGDLTFEFTITPDTSVVGEVTFGLNASGSETAGWPTGVLYGDIQIEGPGDFGPHTFFKYVIKVTPDITQ